MAHCRSRLRDRNRELREGLQARRLVKAASVGVGVHGGTRDDHERAYATGKCVQLLAVVAREGDDVDQDIDAIADRLLQLPLLCPVDVNRPRPCGDPDVPSGRCQPRHHGAADLAGAAKDERCGHSLTLVAIVSCTASPPRFAALLQSPLPARTWPESLIQSFVVTNISPRSTTDPLGAVPSVFPSDLGHYIALIAFRIAVRPVRPRRHGQA